MDVSMVLFDLLLRTCYSVRIIYEFKANIDILIDLIKIAGVKLNGLI